MKSGRAVQFTALDALRGVAALGVALFHFFPGWAGYLAVDFFFVLSGFILSHGYLYGPRQLSLSEFLVHRLARLYPLHVYALGVFVVVAYWLHGRWPSYPDGTVFTLVQHLLLLNNVGLNSAGLTYNEPSWSISVEFVVNLLFFWFVSARTLSLLLAAVALVGFALMGALTGHLDVHYQNYFGYLNAGLVRCVSSFSLGILTYRFYRWWQSETRAFDAASWVEWALVAIVVGVLFARPHKTSVLDFVAPFLFMAVVFVFALEQGWLSSHVRRLAHLGKISYSIYLNQFVVLMVFRSFWPDGGGRVMLLCFLGVLLVYSYATFYWVEQPARLYLRREFERNRSGTWNNT